MLADIQRSLRRLRRRAALGALLGEWSRHLLVAAMACGVAVLLLRLLLEMPTRSASLVFLALLATPFSAWARARRHLLSASGAATWLDVRAGATGALLTELERPDARWDARVRAALARLPEPPALRWRPAASRAVLGLAFALLALWIHVPRSIAGPPTAIFDTALDAVREKLETLEEEIGLDEETAEELAESLERLETEARESENPEATFEALDALEQRLEEEALEAQEAAERIAEQLSDAAARAEEEPATSQEALEQALQKLLEEGLAEQLPSELFDELEAAQFDPAQLTLHAGVALAPEELRNLSREMLEMLQERLEELARAGLLDFGDLKDLAQAGKLGELGDLAELQEFELCELCKDKEPGEP